jgi:ankyrin repeat protein
MSKPLPPHPSLAQLKNQAKDLRRARAEEKLSVARSLYLVAREYGFDSWPKLKRHVESLRSGEGAADLYTACEAGDLDAARAHLALDPELARRKGGFKQREPLLYLCFSPLLADPARAPAMLAIARTLLSLGADPNAYYMENDDPNARQTPLYGAAGVNHNAEMTRLLLEAGADPNDGAPGSGPESLYHASEFSDLTCLRLILEAKPDRDKISYCLARKLDFEDYPGALLYLDHGADPNFVTPHGERWTRLHHAVARGRSARIVALLLDRRADPMARDAHGRTPYDLARRFALTEVADLLRARGAHGEPSERDLFLEACARGDEPAAREILARQPDLIAGLTDQDREVFTDAAERGRLQAVRTMLAVGFDPGGTGPGGATPLHAAAFMGRREAVELLLDHRPPLELRDRHYHATPLQWAIAGREKTAEHNPGGDYAGVIDALLRAGAQNAVPSGS